MRACALFPGDKRRKGLERQLSRDWIPMQQRQACSCTKAKWLWQQEILSYVLWKLVEPFLLWTHTLLSSFILMQELCRRNTTLQTNGAHVHHMYTVGIRLQAHCNHVLTLLYTGNLELYLIKCMYHRNSAEVCEVIILCSILPRRRLFCGGGSGVMVLIKHLFCFCCCCCFSQSNFHCLFCLICTTLPWCPVCITSHSSALCKWDIKFLKGN